MTNFVVSSFTHVWTATVGLLRHRRRNCGRNQYSSRSRCITELQRQLRLQGCFCIIESVQRSGCAPSVSAVSSAAASTSCITNSGGIITGAVQALFCFFAIAGSARGSLWKLAHTWNIAPRRGRCFGGGRHCSSPDWLCAGFSP